MRVVAAFAWALVLLDLGVAPGHADEHVALVAVSPSPMVSQRVIPIVSPPPDAWLTSAEYQQTFDRRVAQRYYPHVVQARAAGDKLLSEPSVRN